MDTVKFGLPVSGASESGSSGSVSGSDESVKEKYESESDEAKRLVMNEGIPGNSTGLSVKSTGANITVVSGNKAASPNAERQGKLQNRRAAAQLLKAGNLLVRNEDKETYDVKPSSESVTKSQQNGGGRDLTDPEKKFLARLKGENKNNAANKRQVGTLGEGNNNLAAVGVMNNVLLNEPSKGRPITPSSPPPVPSAEIENILLHVPPEINLGGKIIQVEPGKEVSISIEGKDKQLVFFPDKDGSVDILLKQKELGKGASGTVFLADSLKTGNKLVLKFAKIEFFNEELDNEAANLSIVNPDGKVAGLQSSVETAKMTRQDGQVITCLKGELYSDGDCENLVVAATANKLFGANLQVLKNNPEKVTQAVDNMCTTFINSLKPPLTGDVLATKLYEFGQPLEAFATKAKVSEKNNLINGLRSILIDKKCHPPTVGKKTNITADDLNQIRDQMKEKISFYMEKAVEKCTVNIDNSTIRSVTGDLVLGVIQMHAKGVVHGDIKPGNFFRDDKRVVIADFGGSMNMNRTESYKQMFQITEGYAVRSYADVFAKAQWGTPEKATVGKALDIRCLGVTIYEMLTGADLCSDRKKIYEDEFYNKMRADLLATDIPEKFVNIIVKMSKPLAMPEGITELQQEQDLIQPEKGKELTAEQVKKNEEAEKYNRAIPENNRNIQEKNTAIAQEFAKKLPTVTDEELRDLSNYLKHGQS